MSSLPLEERFDSLVRRFDVLSRDSSRQDEVIAAQRALIDRLETAFNELSEEVNINVKTAIEHLQQDVESLTD